ncbi:MAG: HAMP domain-containing histidine kinase [Deltaproteobacteria bacterium]|nr:MAG: HAMP domain-containing histidine kinase [Deltaproteobacteria bacterium]
MLWLVGEPTGIRVAELEEMGWYVTAFERARDIVPPSPMVEPVIILASVDMDRGEDLDLLHRLAGHRHQLPVVLVANGEPFDRLEARWRRGAHNILPAGLSPASALHEAWFFAKEGVDAERGASRREQDQKRILERQRVELRHLRRRRKTIEAQLQVALAHAEDGHRGQEELMLALADKDMASRRVNRQWGVLLRDVAAEIKNPMDVIVDGLSKVLDGEVDRAVCDQVARICQSARSLARLVRDLEEMATIEDGTAPVSPSQCDVVCMLSHLAEQLQQRYGLEVALQVGATAGEAMVDAARVCRALIHFLLTDANLPQGPLRIVALADRGAVDICLSPVRTGPGSWRLAELLRHQGGSLRCAGEEVHLRLPMASEPIETANDLELAGTGTHGPILLNATA